MKVLVLRAFPYSADGHTIEHLVPSPGPREIRDDLVGGLAREGYIALGKGGVTASPPAAPAAPVTPGSPPPSPPPPAAKVIEIPADWQEHNWFKLQALVKAITGEKPANKEAAAAAIAAELKKRAEATGAA